MEVKTSYKQTELGIIPKDWGVKKLGDIFSISAGGDLIKGSFSPVLDGDYRYPIYSNSLANRGLYGFSRQYRHDVNSVTVTARGTIGNANARDHKFVAIGRLIVLKPTCEMSCFFVAEYINSRMNFSIESTGVPQLTAPQISKYKIAFPKPDEQTAISTVLSDADALINSLENLIAKKRYIKHGAMQLLLIGKKRLPGFHKKWETKKLKEILEYEQPWKYTVRNTEYSENGTPVLTANKSFLLGYTNETDGICNNTPVIIFDDFTTDSKYVNFPFKVKSSAIKLLRIKDNKTDLRFVFGKMKLIRFHFGDHKRYYISEYQHLEVLVPDLEEQTAIAQVLSDMDSEIEALEIKLEKYRLIKLGVMQELLTGKKRLV